MCGWRKVKTAYAEKEAVYRIYGADTEVRTVLGAEKRKQKTVRKKLENLSFDSF